MSSILVLEIILLIMNVAVASQIIHLGIETDEPLPLCIGFTFIIVNLVILICIIEIHV